MGLGLAEAEDKNEHSEEHHQLRNNRKGTVNATIRVEVVEVVNCCDESIPW